MAVKPYLEEENVNMEIPDTDDDSNDDENDDNNENPHTYNARMSYARKEVMIYISFEASR